MTATNGQRVNVARERISKRVKRRGRKARVVERRCQSSGAAQRFRLIRFAARNTASGSPVPGIFQPRKKPSELQKREGERERERVVLVLAPTSQKTLPRLASLQYLWGCSCERAIPVRASSPRWALKVRTSPNACARESPGAARRGGSSPALSGMRPWDEREKLMSEYPPTEKASENAPCENTRSLKPSTANVLSRKVGRYSGPN